MLDVKPARDRYVERITDPETAMWDIKPDGETAAMDGEPFFICIANRTVINMFVNEQLKGLCK